MTWRSRVLTLGLGLLSLGGQACIAGTVTVESNRGQQDALTRAREKMPAGATEQRFECRDIVEPMRVKFHQCTIYFETQQSQP